MFESHYQLQSRRIHYGGFKINIYSFCCTYLTTKSVKDKLVFYILTKLDKLCVKVLTYVPKGGNIQPQLNRLDRGAVNNSIGWQGLASVGQEREYRRSLRKVPGFLMLVRQRTSAGLSHNYL